MGIRSLLRNVFSRSRAGREEQAPPAAGTAGATDATGTAAPAGGAGESGGTAVPEQSRGAGEPAGAEGSVPAQSRRTTGSEGTGPAGKAEPEQETGGISADLMSAFDQPRTPEQRTAASEDAKDAASGKPTGGKAAEPSAATPADATADTAGSADSAATSGSGPAAEANRAAEEAIAEAGSLSAGAVPEPVTGPAGQDTAGSADKTGGTGRDLAAEGSAEARAEVDAVTATVAELSGDAPPEPVKDAKAEAAEATDGKPAPGTETGAGTAADEAKAEAASLAGDNDPTAPDPDAGPEKTPATAEGAGTTAKKATAAKKTAAPKKTTAAKTTAAKTAPEKEAAPAEAPEPEQSATEQSATEDTGTAGQDSGTAAGNGPAAGAIPPEKLRKTAPGLVSLYKAASAALDKEGLAGQRAAVYLVLDRSGSMRGYYKDGTVQHLAEQALGLSANLDDDGTVPVVFFSTDIDGTADIALDDYKGRIEALHADLGHMGRTNYHRAIETVVEHYKKSGSTAPAFVIFQTDGAPTSKAAAEKALCEAAELPLFWQFIGFGETDAKGFDFLRKLDNLSVPERRKADNAGFFHAGPEPKKLTNRKLYEQLLAEFPTWLEEAREKGILG
ncbi:VWA domain-containing protein [Streptomyces sp. S07_1.15]|uniref:VWA domain-containing protein n=1 Tax=Streptomyces sp. S07_1.15 TaxID=2873925 RepID=UPI001D155F00|nr:VWA domain-containing protein [Streptomyces sp. S07_1.15]MCC3652915.1 VWA domain-containing protein [Streptomyces sp. S07_1.15]